MEFTEQQIRDFKAFQRVRLSGRWNMFDPQARAATRLDEEEYIFVMKHYEALRDAAGDKAKAVQQ